MGFGLGLLARRRVTSLPSLRATRAAPSPRHGAAITASHNKGKAAEKKKKKGKGGGGGAEEGAVTRPPRLLCLHGYGQDGQGFREKTGSMRKVLKKMSADLVYVDAPYSTLEEDHPDAMTALASGYSWWQDAAEARKEPPPAYRGFDAAVSGLQATLVEQGPFDGVLGFSQGAMVAALLGALTNEVEGGEGSGHGPALSPAGWDPSIRLPPLFAVVFAGFVPYAKDIEQYFDALESRGGSSGPSLHVVGDNDRIIVPERSLRLAGCFRDPTVIHHPKGHLVPSSADVRNSIRDFITEQMEGRGEADAEGCGAVGAGGGGELARPRET